MSLGNPNHMKPYLLKSYNDRFIRPTMLSYSRRSVPIIRQWLKGHSISSIRKASYFISASLILGGCGGSAGNGYPRSQAAQPSPDDGIRVAQILPNALVTSNGKPRIIFAAYPDVTSQTGNLEIYSSLSDGSDLVRLTTTTAADREPSWNRTALGGHDKIAYIRTTGVGIPPKSSGFSLPQPTELHLLDTTTGQDVIVANASRDKESYQYLAYPRFSPDGQRMIVAVFYGDGTSSLRLFNTTPQPGTGPSYIGPAGGKPTSGFTATGYAWRKINDLGGYADWSPTSEQIVFSAREKDSVFFSLYVIGTNGLGQKKIATPTPVISPDPSDRRAFVTDYLTPSWSPDGQSILFTNFHDDYYAPDTPLIRHVDLYRCNADGTGFAPVVTSPSPTVQYLAPRYSPDGQQIIFTRRSTANDGQVSQGSSIMTCNSDGTNVHNIVSGRFAASTDW